MRIRTIAAAGALLALAATAAPAGAATILTTYSGTVLGGYDQTGLFGPAGGTLVGATFTIQYATDTAEGGASNYLSPTQTYAIGGTYYGTQPPPTFGSVSPVSATLTVNSVSVAIDGAFLGWAYANNDDASNMQGELYNEADEFQLTSSGYEQKVVWNDVTNPSTASSIPSDYRTVGTYTLQPGDAPSGYFGIFVKDLSQDGYLVNTWGELTFDSVTISSTPEPGAWTLMILGLGGAGLMLRRRRAALVA